jgi:TRAP-type C4-dicarboxylate transport system substrate-binding protein
VTTDATTSDSVVGQPAATDHATLDIAMTPGWDSIVEPFIADVDQRSAGSVSVGIDYDWLDAHQQNDVEQQIVDAVASGELDLGLVGTRAFKELGLTSFDALTAPFLIDSYSLQEAVLNSDMTAEMLETLDQLGVAGLAVIAGPLRRPLSTEALVLGPLDFAGLNFHTFRSPTNAATVAALGATHTDVWGEARDSGLEDGSIDATENGLEWVVNNGRTTYATLNAAFWPATAVLVVNPDSLSELSTEQLDTLDASARQAFDTSTELASTDAELITQICASGKRFAEASADDLAALRDAVQPVYDVLDDDPVTAGHLEQIEALAASAPPDELTIPEGCTGAASTPEDADVAGTDDPSALNGSYRLDWTVDELMAGGAPEDIARGNDGGFVLTLRDGSFDQTWDNEPNDTCPGKYAVSGDRITMVATSDITEWDCGNDTLGVQLLDAQWSLTNDQLALSNFVRSDEPDITWWTSLYFSKPMSRVE